MRIDKSYSLILLATILMLGPSWSALGACGGQAGAKDCSPGGPLAALLARDTTARIGRKDVGVLSAGDSTATFTAITVSPSSDREQVIKALEVRLEGKGQSATIYLNPDRLGDFERALAQMADGERGELDKWRAEDVGQSIGSHGETTGGFGDDESGSGHTLRHVLNVGIYLRGSESGVSFDVPVPRGCIFRFPGVSLGKVVDSVHAGLETLGVPYHLPVMPVAQSSLASH
jgi:hypothetical protein